MNDMAKITQREIILRYLRSIPDQWVKAYDLRGKATPFGFSGHQADRRARELAEEGLIEVQHSKYAEYRAMKPKKVEWFVVPATGERFSKTIW